MLYFIQSNRLELLFDRLCQIVEESQASPLQPQEIVVQNQGMARWVSQQLAIQKGVAGNLLFPLPARFIWQVLASQLALQDDERTFGRSVMLWKIFGALKELDQPTSFQEVAGYLQGDHDGRKTYHLAGKIADLFDQYLVYRPDMLLQWESEPSPGWQATLWKKLTASSRMHRARYLELFRQKVQQKKLDPSQLPQNVYLFGISSLAPVYLQFFYSISSVVNVFFFHLNPCREYWTDVVSSGDVARMRTVSKAENNEDNFTYYEFGNPLLASHGKMGREFLSLVYEMDTVEEENYARPKGNSMLSYVQGDILDLKDHSKSEAEKRIIQDDDYSVQLHSCHSRMREVQVLHDRLLEMFERDPDLQPGDILVMAPSIEEYSFAIHSVFDGAAGRMYIPWSLADRSLRGEKPLADSFLSLLDLCASRCSAPDVLSFLEIPAVMRRFSIDEEGLATIRSWINESGIRWGLNQEHRREFNQTIDDTHSWHFGMNRLFMGYFMGVEQGLVQGISPCGTLTAEKALLLGRLAAFLDQLQKTQEELLVERGLPEWQVFLLQTLDAFYDPGTNEEDQQTLLTLRDAICSLGEDSRQADLNQTVQQQVIRSWLNDILTIPVSGQAFLSGRATFCNMVPMRSVPFKVICLLGMNDTDYPRNQRKVGFDLMAKEPKKGDRNRREDDRYLFLEALISARDVMYISWIGHDQRDNSIRPPSVVVADLLDYMVRSFVNVSGSAVDWPVLEHPLQPFSRRCFDGTPGSASFAIQWLPKAIDGRKCFIDHPLPEPPTEWRAVELAQLVRFWSHPVQYFLQHRLEMKVPREEDLPQQNEPFQPDHLDRYMLTSRLVEAGIEDLETENQYVQFMAEGLLPHGNFGRNFFHDLQTNADELLQILLEIITDPVAPQEVDLKIDSFRVSGWLTGLFAKGCVRYRPAKLKGRDLIKLWIEHLAYNAANNSKKECRSIFIAHDEIVTLHPVAEPFTELQSLLGMYWQGLSLPLHFYPETSRAWFEADEARKMVKAVSAWEGDFMKRGEGDVFEYRIAFEGADPLDNDFEEVAAAVLTPLYKHLEKGIAEF